MTMITKTAETQNASRNLPSTAATCTGDKQTRQNSSMLATAAQVDKTRSRDEELEAVRRHRPAVCRRHLLRDRTVDLVAHALVVLDRRAAQSDVHALPPCGAHAAGVFFTGAETSTEIDIDSERFESALGKAHRD